MVKQKLILVLFISLLVNGCYYSSSRNISIAPTSDSEIRFSVFPDEEQQTIIYVGVDNVNTIRKTADFSHENSSKFDLSNIDLTHVLVSIPIHIWEPENDDADPNNFSWAAFRDVGQNHESFLTMQEYKRTNTIVLAYFEGIPGWIETIPNGSGKNLVHINDYPEIIEAIAAWLLTAQNNYSVYVDYIAFKESGKDNQLSLPPSSYAAFLRQVYTRFNSLGIQTKWLISDSGDLKKTIDKAQAILPLEDVNPSIGPLMINPQALDTTDELLLKLAELSQYKALEVWIVDDINDEVSSTSSESNQDWLNTMNLAVIFTRLLKLGRASTVSYRDFHNVNDQTQDQNISLSTSNVLRQMARQIPPGSRIVATSNDLSCINWVAAQAPSHFMVQLVNICDQPITIDIMGAPSGHYTWIYISEHATEEIFQVISIQNTRSTPTTIPPSSINILTSQSQP